MTEPIWQRATVFVLRLSKVPMRDKLFRGATRPHPHAIEYRATFRDKPAPDAFVYTLPGSSLTKLGHPAGVAAEAEVRDAFFADRECTQLICRTLMGPRDSDGRRRYTVVGPDGHVVGEIERVPPRNRFANHSWRMRQPGQPELSTTGVTLGRLRDGAITTAFGLAAGYLTDLVFSNSNTGGDSPTARTLHWWTIGVPPTQKALSSSSSCAVGQPWQVWVDWLDRRLVFAQMMIRDSAHF